MAEYKKNDELTLEIRDVSEQGAGIGKKDGFTVFVKDTIPGDTVLAGLTKVKKHYAYARLIKVIVPSIDRITPKCPVAKTCGGCQLQRMSYPAELRLKENKVRNDLIRIGQFENPPFEGIIGMDNPWRYRNKAQVPVGMTKEGRLCAGFYAQGSHRIVPCTDCLLSPEEFGIILDTVLQWMKENHLSSYDEPTGRGLVRHVLIRKGFSTGQILICLIVNLKKKTAFPAGKKLVKKLLELFPDTISGIVFSRNIRRDNVIMGDAPEVLFGQNAFEDRIGPILYHISAESFYQVNPAQTEKIYKTVLEYAGLSGEETVLDLYCGIGTISLFLAQRAEKVIGVEIIPRAVQDARENAKANKITNCSFYAGKAEEVVPELLQKEKIQADVVVVDPPRKGLEPSLIETIRQIAPKRIVYVSCDPATLARDLKIFCAEDYQFKKAIAFDQFSGSVHVETVVLMSRRKD